MKFNSLRRPIVFMLCVSIVSCSTTRTVTQEHGLAGTSRTIHVILHDGRTITFSANEYRISETDTAFSIEGVGIQISGEERREAPFRGSIGSREMREIQVVEPTPLSESLFPLSLGIAGVLMLMYVALNNAHWAE